MTSASRYGGYAVQQGDTPSHIAQQVDLPWIVESHPAQFVSARRQAEREGRAAANDCLDDVVWDEGMPAAFDAQRWALEAADQAKCLAVHARWRPVFERAFVRFVRITFRWELAS